MTKLFMNNVPALKYDINEMVFPKYRNPTLAVLFFINTWTHDLDV